MFGFRLYILFLVVTVARNIHFYGTCSFYMYVSLLRGDLPELESDLSTKSMLDMLHAMTDLCSSMCLGLVPQVIPRTSAMPSS